MNLRKSLLKIVPLIALALMLLPQLALAAQPEVVPQEAAAIELLAQAPSLCAAAPLQETAPLASLAAQLGLQAETAQCRKDDDCVAVCPCLPQCDQGVCANCLWCPPGG